MNDDTNKKVSRVRTFAQDLDVARAKREKEPKQKTEPIKKAVPELKKKSTPTKVNDDSKKTPEKVEVKKPEPKKVVSVKPPTPETKKAPGKIPAFQNLQHQVDSIHSETKEVEKKPEPKKIKQIKTSDKVKVGFDATVITDNKSNRFKLFPAIAAALKDWFKSLKPKKKKIPPPKYTVPKASERKEVIQKATTKTGARFSNDNKALKEQIKLREEKKAEKKITADTIPAEPEHEPETIWTPYTETGYNLLEEENEVVDATQNVNLEFKKHSVPTEEVELEPIPVPKLKTAVTEEAELVSEEINTEIKEASPEAETDNLIPDRWSGVNEQIDIEPKNAPAPAKETTTYVPKNNPEESPAGLKEEIINSKTNTLTLIILVILVGVLIVFFVARIMFNSNFTLNGLFNQTEVIEEEPISKIEPLLTNSEVKNIVLTSSKLNTLVELINQGIDSSSEGITELPVTSLTGEEISASYLFNLLDFNTKATLKQSINTARFISHNQSEPALVIKFVDENTIKGGLLNWESNMSEDLKPIYKQTTAAIGNFRDETIGQIDVRVLTSDTDTLIVYGFINKNTVIISPDLDSFVAIKNTLK